MPHFEPKPFGKYFLVERLAVGGMAEIYKAKTFGVDGFEKLLAIKKILPHYSADKEFISMLTDEAKLVVRLSHTNIVQIYDLGKVGDDYFISMEYIDGVNLREVVNRATLIKDKVPLPICLYIISEVCKGLDYAHSKRDEHGQPLNIVHRDVSPQNILISFEGETKIVDFGIAKAALNISHTTAGILKGKVTYMSPEQAVGKAIDGRTDIFSAGLLLYEIVTGERFFTGETQIEILQKIRETPITMDRLAGKIPDELRPILAKALTFDPSDRYETAGDFQIALTRLLYSGYADFAPKQLATLIKKWFEPELKVRRRQAMQEATPIDSRVRSLLKAAPGQKTIVHVEGKTPVKGMMQDTTKPEEGFTFSFLERDTGGKPLPTGKFSFKHLAWIGPLVAALFLGIFLWPAKPDKPPAVGSIEVTSIPAGAALFLDGEETGQATPATLTDLEEGRDYFIRLSKEGFAPFEKKVRVEGKTPVPVAAALVPVPFGSLKISSKPPGAQVTINGEETGETTPVILEKLPAGETVKITLEKEGYLPFEKEAAVEGEKTVEVEAVLEEKILGTLEIRTQPDGAAVFLDGKNTGFATPIRLTNLETPKTYEIILRKEKYADQTQTVEVTGRRSVLVNVPLQLLEAYQVGSLTVKTNVKGASVSINSQDRGIAPGPFEVKAGKLEVTVSKSGYISASKTVILNVGEAKETVFELKPEVVEKKTEPPVKTKTEPPIKTKTEPPPPRGDQEIIPGLGDVRVDSSPRGASVLISGKKAGTTPVVIPRLSKGTSYTLTLNLPGYRSWTKTFTLSRNHVEFMARMERE